MPRVLAIGGLDPCGGAGVTADVRVLHAHGCEPAAVTTCLTVQNRAGVTRIEPIAPELFRAMVRAVFDDGPVDVVKVGLCGAPVVVEALAELLAGFEGPVVVDPVLVTTAGGWQAPAGLVTAYQALLRAVPAIWTPNALELSALVGDAGSVGLLALGAQAVFEKGGHADGNEVVDAWVTPAHRSAFRHRRAVCGAVHGTGCALAASFAAGLAHGRDPAGAARSASRWVSACLHAMGGGEAQPRPFDPTAAASRVRRTFRKTSPPRA